MNTIKVSVLLIVVLVVAAGCNHTGKPRTFDREQARLYPRVLYKAINDNKDSLDFILLLETFYEEFGKDKKPYQLSVDEMKMAKKILEKYRFKAYFSLKKQNGIFFYENTIFKLQLSHKQYITADSLDFHLLG